MTGGDGCSNCASLLQSVTSLRSECWQRGDMIRQLTRDRQRARDSLHATRSTLSILVNVLAEQLEEPEREYLRAVVAAASETLESLDAS